VLIYLIDQRIFTCIIDDILQVSSCKLFMGIGSPSVTTPPTPFKTPLQVSRR